MRPHWEHLFKSRAESAGQRSWVPTDGSWAEAQGAEPALHWAEASGQMGGTAWEAALSTGGLTCVLGQGEERALTAGRGFSVCPPLPQSSAHAQQLRPEHPTCAQGKRSPLGGLRVLLGACLSWMAGKLPIWRLPGPLGGAARKGRETPSRGQVVVQIMRDHEENTVRVCVSFFKHRSKRRGWLSP